MSIGSLDLFINDILRKIVLLYALTPKISKLSFRLWAAADFTSEKIESENPNSARTNDVFFAQRRKSGEKFNKDIHKQQTSLFIFHSASTPV
jgi:hypothetical protein